MTYFLKSGSTFRVSNKESMDLHEKLPAGNYIVKMDPMENLYLEKIEGFERPKKLYGNTTRHSGRIINTFKDRSQSTGVMLNGEKGSGKTLLAKNIAIELAEQGIPTIVINAPWCGDKFNKLLQDIEQPCMVLFDEFEKVYDRDQQESILTLLDGVFGSKKLYVLTCNDKWRVDEHMRNRPGRIFYMLDFKGLDVEFIREYCEDNLDRKDHIEKICKISTLFGQFNFDMLKALVEEMNRYGETPQEALAMLNAKPEFSSTSEYNVRLIYKGKEVPKEKLDSAELAINPLRADGFNVEFYAKDENNDDDEIDGVRYMYEHFEPANLEKLDASKGMFTFNNGTAVVILTKVLEKQQHHYYAL